MASFSTTPADVQRRILQLCTFTTLAMLRGTSKHWHRMVADCLASSWMTILSRFFRNPNDFRAILRLTDSIVSGSLILYIILQATEYRNWIPGDMDIYSPVELGAFIVYYLCNQEGYVHVHSRGDSRRRPIRPYGFGDIGTVVKLYHPTRGTKVDVICSAHSSPTFPLTFFWGTPVMNYFTADELCIAYPKWTLHGVGFVRPSVAVDRRVERCARKYARRGFGLDTLSSAPHGYGNGIDGAYCAHSDRFFGDAACMVFRFGQYHSSNRTGRDPIYGSNWKFGGPVCCVCGNFSVSGYFSLATTVFV